MNRDDLDGLVCLKVVAQRRSFARAALELKVSPSAVSQTIKQLESRLGIALLTRTTRSVTLTEAGARFLGKAGPAIEEISAALQEVGTYAEKPSGVLRLNLPKLFFWTYLSPVVASFKKKYPEVSVELCLDDAQSDVVGEGFDAGIRLSDILAKDMVAIKLRGPVRFVTAASPKYLEKAGRPRHPRDLLNHDCIRGRLGKRIYDNWEFEHRKAEFQVHVKGSFIVNDSLALQKMAVDGLGVTYTDEASIKSLVSSGKLEILLAPFAATSSGYYLYFPKVSQVQPKLRAFIEHLRQFKF